MNYTLKQLAQLFVDEISGGQEVLDTPLDVRDVMMNIRFLMNAVLKNEVYAKLNEGDRSAVTQYIKSQSISLTADSTEKRKIATLADWYISLPYNKGVHRVTDAYNPAREIIPVGNIGTVRHTKYAKSMESMMLYSLEGKKIIFEPHKDLDKLNSVLVKTIIAAPSTITESDALPLIPEQIQMVMDGLRKTYRPMPQDVLNDGKE